MYLSKLCVLPAFILASGCQTITSFGDTFQGANDYRIIPASASAASGSDSCSIPTSVAAPKCYSMSNFSRFQDTKDINTSDLFAKGDHIGFSIKTVYINMFSEGEFQDQLNKAFSSNTKGEIALLANVTQGQRNASNMDANGNLQGKVVFYSDDVYQGQTLNEFNFPIFDTIEWGGGPVTIQIWTIELDQKESQEFGSVLRTLTSVLRSPLGLSPYGSSILSQIGTSYLNSNKDDVIGYISITLDPLELQASMKTGAILQNSDIIIARSSDRTEGVKFEQCIYESKQASLYCNPSGRYSYLVMSVKELSDKYELVQSINLAELNAALLKGNLAKEGELRDITDKIIIEQDKASSSERANLLLSGSLDSNRAQSMREYDGYKAARLIQCALLARDVSELSAETASAAKSYCGGESRWSETALDEKRLDRVFRRIVAAGVYEPSALNKSELLGDSASDWPTKEIAIGKKLASAAQ